MFVEVFGRKAYFIIPINGPAVEGVIAKVLRILEFDENALVVELGEIEQAHVAIAEGKLQQVAGDILGSDNVYEFCIHFGLFIVIGKDGNFLADQQILFLSCPDPTGHPRLPVILNWHLSMVCGLINFLQQKFTLN